MAAEVFIKIRWRLHIVCQSCGFDPVVYVRNPQKAAELVTAYMDRRSRDPIALLRRPLNLPSRAQPPVNSLRKVAARNPPIKPDKKMVSLKI